MLPSLPFILPPLADGEAIIGAIITIAVVVFGILSNANEARKKKQARRSQGNGGASALDERIRRRQAERRGERYQPVEAEVVDVDDDASIPTHVAGVRLSPEDRQAIAKARREQAAEERRQAQVEARRRREQQEQAEQRREAQARQQRSEARAAEELEQRRRPSRQAAPAKATGVSRHEIGAGGGEIGSGKASPSAKRSNQRADRMRQLLRRPDSIKTIILAGEILAKPVSLREA